MQDRSKWRRIAGALLALAIAGPWFAEQAGAAPVPMETEAETEERAAPEPIRPPIDINAAGEEELIRLPGVGPETARRIVEFRRENGPFQRAEDLMKVKGIGEKSFQKLRPSITVGTKK